MVFPYIILFLFLFLHFFQRTGVVGAKFTLVNNCSEIIWPAIVGRPTLETTGFELPPGNSVAVQSPSMGWRGRVWGRTSCTFNASGYGSCATGECGSGRLECKTNAAPATTLVELTLGSLNSLDNYDVSLVHGFNLPVLVEPSGSAQCGSPGCAEDINQICPSDLRTQGGRACRDACEAFKTSEYCCTDTSECGPTSYSAVFKKACPDALSYPQDDATSTFTCSGGGDYFITFCPSTSSSSSSPTATSLAAQTGFGMPPAQPPAYSFPTRNTDGKKHSKVIIIVEAICITCVIIAFIIFLCILKRCHSTSVPNKESKQLMENFLLQHGSVAPKRYKYSEIKKITKSFSDKLGKGGYGSVYKGVLPDGSPVAVKVLMETDNNGEEFINEVASISRTFHVNVVTLLGYCYDGDKRALVYEFMPNKSLDTFLSNDGSAENTDCSLDLQKLYEISVGIAKGLEYLHTGCPTRIVHFDIKPQNILLDEDFCPKIADFGLAKLCKKKQSVLSVLGTRGTIGYIAPEVFSRTFGGVSHKSDVYSYGMMILEMAGAKKVSEATTLQSSENYFPDKIYEHAIHGITRNLDGFIIEDAEEIKRKILLVGFWCIQTTPSDRPPMSKVVEMLEGSIEAIQIPPKPVLFTPTLPQQEYSLSLSAYTETQSSIQIITNA